jgi:hypothetical protein
MKTTITIVLLFVLSFVSIYHAEAQLNTTLAKPTDVVTLGLGLGLDNGGIGANLIFYPQRNIGIFGGLGYALAGAGWNVGLKLRTISDKPSSNVSFFLLAMYGYNAAIAVTNKTSLNKIFNGPTFGLGIDTRMKPDKRHYWSFALLIPVRSSEVDDYIDYLKLYHGVEFKNQLIPFGISISYKYCLSKRN